MPADRDGQRGRVTMADVARDSGVSVMTVSYALSRPERVATDTRERVLASAHRLGYRGPDPRGRSLRRRRSDCLGVLLGEHLSYAFEDPMATRFLAGIGEELVRTGHGLTIIPTSGGTHDPARVANAAVDAFVVWTTSPDDAALRAAVATGRPVIVHAGPRIAGTRCVGIDDRAAARAVAEAAFRDAQRPAVLSMPLNPCRDAYLGHGVDVSRASFPVTRNRLRGVLDHCADRGITPDDLLVSVIARHDAEHGRAAARELVARRPDAIMAMSDQLAALVLEEAAAAGLRVPDDLAVTGWDDGPSAARLGLTTVSNDLRSQGATCARLALGLQTANPRVPWRLIERTSTRPDEDRV